MRQLRKKLTLLYTITTGFILTVVVIGILFFNTVKLQETSRQLFKEQLFSITSRMQFGSTINASFLAQTEAAGRSIIHIEENEIPLLYSGSWTPKTDRQTLINRAKEKAKAEMVNTSVRPVSSPVVQSSVFTVRGDYSDTYLASVLILPTTKGFQSLTLLTYQTPSKSLVIKQAPLFLLFNLIGIGALFLVSWFFVGKSLQPVEAGQARQARFIAAASHELRSPLAVIESSTSAAQAADTPGEQARYLGNIHRECRRMASLVGDMLLLASSDAGSWSLNLQTVDMDTLLIGIYEAFLPLCRERDIHLHLCLPEDVLPNVEGDSARLEQVLTILLDNAVFYTPAEKSIELSARIKGNELLLQVADQGPGIPDKEKELIFERFYRGDTSRTDKKHFGLGLSIAKELILQHHGSITVRDTEAGDSCFEVRLPV